jgi:hypothetical protein
MINQDAERQYLNKDGELIIRASEASRIMASLKSDKLPEGAMTYVEEVFKMIYLNYNKPEISKDEFQKGHKCESGAIELLNLIYDEDYEKNEIRKGDGYFKGTCDILKPKKYIRDTKCPWSKITFPITEKEAKNTNYEYQLRVYMRLYDVPEAFLDYCLITTPVELRKPYESPKIHEMDDLPLNLRKFTLQYKRDPVIEQLMVRRVEQCRIYFDKLKKQFKQF